MVRVHALYLCGRSWHLALAPSDGQPLFHRPGDYVTCQEQLLDLLLRYGVQLHAYVLLPNAVHLLLTPLQQSDLEPIVKQLNPAAGCHSWGQRCASQASAPGWRADVLAAGSDLLSCYRYIELCPQRLGLVPTPAAYYFSSYRRNALELADPLVTPHRSYLDLGRCSQARARSYRDGCWWAAVAMGVDTSQVAPDSGAPGQVFAPVAGEPQSAPAVGEPVVRRWH